MGKVIVKIVFDENYGVYSDSVPGCVATHNTLEGVKTAYKEALEMHLEGLRKDGGEIPPSLQAEFELSYDLNVRAILKHLDGILTRTAIARYTGIAPKQLSHYISGVRNPRPKQQEKIVNAIRAIAKELLSVV